MTSYPGIKGLFHKPLFSDPKKPTSIMESKGPRIFFSWLIWDWHPQSATVDSQRFSIPIRWCSKTRTWRFGWPNILGSNYVSRWHRYFCFKGIDSLKPLVERHVNDGFTVNISFFNDDPLYEIWNILIQTSSDLRIALLWPKVLTTKKMTVMF